MRPKIYCLLAFSTCAIAATLACRDQSDTTMQPSGETAQAGAPAAILLAAGDIAGCADHYQDEVTAEMLADLPGTIAPLGDLVYQDATRWQFRNCYDPTWGRLLARTRPAPGNHEYRTDQAGPYYEYFGSRAGPTGKGYYTYTLGTWRIYSLNSERNFAEQTSWLTSHLAANPSKCILAYWHKPLYTSGQVPPTPAVRPMFDALYKAGAEVVLNGHQHNYERFAPQDADSNFQPRGTRQFVVGTGGAQLEDFVTVAKNSKLRYVAGWGVLRMTLSPGKYSWNFLPVPGSPPADSGFANCT
jgi:acid phosphatase type 7